MIYKNIYILPNMTKLLPILILINLCTISLSILSYHGMTVNHMSIYQSLSEILLIFL